MNNIVELNDMIFFDESKNSIFILNQFLLPGKKEVMELKTLSDVFQAVEKMYIRGAGLIGVCAAYGLVMILKNIKTENVLFFIGQMRMTAEYLCGAKPSITNLKEMVLRVEKAALSSQSKQIDEMKNLALNEAKKIHQEDYQASVKLADISVDLIKDKKAVLTCGINGKLASTGPYGIALAPVYKLHEKGITIPVFVTENRPLFDGSRVLAYELELAKIPYSILCDGMIATLMANNEADCVLLSGYDVDENGSILCHTGALNLAIVANYFQIDVFIFMQHNLTIEKINFYKSEENLFRKSFTDVWFKRPITTSLASYYGCTTDIIPKKLVTKVITDRGVIYEK